MFNVLFPLPDLSFQAATKAPSPGGIPSPLGSVASNHRTGTTPGIIFVTGEVNNVARVLTVAVAPDESS